MMMFPSATFLTVLLSSGLLVGQAPTIQASMTQSLTASGGLTTNYLPTGPVPAGGASVTAWDPGGQASVSARELTGLPANASGFEFNGSGYAAPQFWAPASYLISGVILLQLTLPTPTPVLISVQGTAIGSGAVTTTVDIGADSSIESVLDPTTGAVQDSFPVVVGPSGVFVRLTMQGSGWWNGFGPAPNCQSNLSLEFAIGHATVANYGTGCFPLIGSLSPSDDLQLTCPAPAGSLVIVGFGTTAMSVPLPFAPGCFLLLDPLATVVVVPAGGQANLSLSNAAPPIGSQYRLQAARLSAAGLLDTSGGVVLTGI